MKSTSRLDQRDCHQNRWEEHTHEHTHRCAHDRAYNLDKKKRASATAKKNRWSFPLFYRRSKSIQIDSTWSSDSAPANTGGCRTTTLWEARQQATNMSLLWPYDKSSGGFSLCHRRQAQTAAASSVPNQNTRTLVTPFPTKYRPPPETRTSIDGRLGSRASASSPGLSLPQKFVLVEQPLLV